MRLRQHHQQHWINSAMTSNERPEWEAQMSGLHLFKAPYGRNWNKSYRFCRISFLRTDRKTDNRRSHGNVSNDLLLALQILLLGQEAALDGT